MSRFPTAIFGAILVYAGLAYGTGMGLILGVIGLTLILIHSYSLRDGLLLGGPFTLWDLVRTARRKKMFQYRTFLVCVLAIVIWLTIRSYADSFYGSRRGLSSLSLSETVRLTETIVILIGICMIGYCLLFALFTLPSVLAEERETNRIEHLFVTDLRNHEIILGKVLGRLAVLMGYVIVPIPILAIFTLYGGVDPNLVIVATLLLFTSLAGLTGIALACSATAKNTRSAVRATIFWLFAQMIFFPVLSIAEKSLEDLQVSVQGGYPPIVSMLASQLISAIAFILDSNPIRITSLLATSLSNNTFDTTIFDPIRRYAAGQWMFLCVGWWIASRSIRQSQQPKGSEFRSESAISRFRRWSELPYRPPVTDQPVLWYERSTPSTFFGRVMSKLLKGRWWLLLILAAVPIILLLGAILLRGERLSNYMSITGGLAFFLITMPVGFTATRLVARERQLDTLSAILITDLEPDEIIRQKWWAAILSARTTFLIFLLMWMSAVVVGEYPLTTVVTLVSITLANAGLAASLGLLCSIYSVSPAKAAGRLLGYSLLWLIAFGTCSCVSSIASIGPRSIYLLALMPLFTQSAASWPTPDRMNRASDESSMIFITVLLGVGISAFVAFMVRVYVETTFQDQTQVKPVK